MQKPSDGGSAAESSRPFADSAASDAANGPPSVVSNAGSVGRLLAAYERVPLYMRIVGGLVLGVAVGVLLHLLIRHPSAGHAASIVAAVLDKTSKLVIQFLSALAPPLIMLAIVRALVEAKIEGRQGRRLIFLLALNTTVAIGIGLLVANTVRPGHLVEGHAGQRPLAPKNVVDQLLENVPSSLVRPFVDNNVIAVVILALVFGLAMRRLADPQRIQVQKALAIGFDLILMVLHWVIWLVPLAVFCKVASIIGKEGFEPFVALGAFVLAVVLALLLQGTWYLLRIRWRSWVRPLDLISKMRDALVMAFSTDSSTATMPVTYELLRKKVGLRERSASLGALVGSNFNNDGTALYEAMAALFVAQIIHADLSLTQQLMVVLTSIVASVGAAGIPEAGLVTMTLVFGAVNLPTEYIPFLLPVDWFLDRCRTTINVMGDVNVSCLLDGEHRESEGDAERVPVAVAAV